MKNDLQEKLNREVQDYAGTLNALVRGTYDFDGEESDDYDFSDLHDRLSWYFGEPLDIEFRTDAEIEFKGAVITLAYGGPGIYYDTALGVVKGYWGDDRARYFVDSDTRKEISDFWEDVFYRMRGR